MTRLLQGVERFSVELIRQTGLYIEPRNIISAESIQNHHLELNPGAVLILTDAEHGYLHLILTAADFEQLQTNNFLTADFIATREIYYGFYRGDNHWQDIFWQSLEKGKGIQDARFIQRQLAFFHCWARYGILRPRIEICGTCLLGDDQLFCPKWHDCSLPEPDNVIYVHDPRTDLVDALKAWLQEAYGLRLQALRTHTSGAVNELWLQAATNPNTAIAYVSDSLLTSLLYSPSLSSNWSERLEEFYVVLIDGAKFTRIAAPEPECAAASTPSQTYEQDSRSTDRPSHSCLTCL